MFVIFIGSKSAAKSFIEITESSFRKYAYFDSGIGFCVKDILVIYFSKNLKFAKWQVNDNHVATSTN